MDCIYNLRIYFKFNNMQIHYELYNLEYTF